jgi:hypothetical protein
LAALAITSSTTINASGGTFFNCARSNRALCTIF